jgi:hypothetical protein
MVEQRRRMVFAAGTALSLVWMRAGLGRLCRRVGSLSTSGWAATRRNRSDAEAHVSEARHGAPDLKEDCDVGHPPTSTSAIHSQIMRDIVLF